jgi:hypothetical protein
MPVNIDGLNLFYSTLHLVQKKGQSIILPHKKVSFLVSAKDSGLPVIQRMNAPTAAAMIADANLTRTQQQIVSKYMLYAF